MRDEIETLEAARALAKDDPALDMDLRFMIDGFRDGDLTEDSELSGEIAELEDTVEELRAEIRELHREAGVLEKKNRELLREREVLKRELEIVQGKSQGSLG